MDCIDAILAKMKSCIEKNRYTISLNENRQENIDFINQCVISNICCYSGKILERFTHNETPWLATRGDLPITAPSDRIIGKSLIGDYFTAVKEKYNMVNPSDIRAYAQDMFHSSF